jgi:hypothetical protein
LFACLGLAWMVPDAGMRSFKGALAALAWPGAGLAWAVAAGAGFGAAAAFAGGATATGAAGFWPATWLGRGGCIGLAGTGGAATGAGFVGADAGALTTGAGFAGAGAVTGLAGVDLASDGTVVGGAAGRACGGTTDGLFC